MLLRVGQPVLAALLLLLCTRFEMTGSRQPEQPVSTMDFGSNEDMSGRRVHFVTVETRAKSSVVRLAGPKGWDFYLRNLGENIEFRWFETKLKRLIAFLESPGDDQTEDEIDDHDVIVWLDGEDVMYGGCDLAQDFLPRFLALEEIARNSRKKKHMEAGQAAASESSSFAPIIFGAEFNCFEVPERLWGPHGTPHSAEGCDKRSYRVSKAQRSRMLRRFGLTASEVDAWGSPMGGGQGDPSLLYLNSGFFAGRARAVREFLPRWLDAYHRANQMVDQAAARAAKGHALANMKVWLTKQGREGEQQRFRVGDQAGAQLLWDEGEPALAIDYAGVLVNNVALRRSALLNTNQADGARPDPAARPTPAFSFEPKTKTWVDGATNLPLCFVHMSGGAEKEAIVGMERAGHDYRRTWTTLAEKGQQHRAATDEL